MLISHHNIVAFLVLVRSCRKRCDGLSIRFIFVWSVTMSAAFTFGSLGDLIAISTLVYQLARALNESSGSAKAYQDLRHDLDIWELDLQTPFCLRRGVKINMIMAFPAVRRTSCPRCLKPADIVEGRYAEW